LYWTWPLSLIEGTVAPESSSISSESSWGDDWRRPDCVFVCKISCHH